MKVKKLTKAQRELAAADEALLKKWATVPKFARTAKPVVTPKAVQQPVTSQRPPSLVTPGGSTPLKPAAKYTGTAMIGIATMHKSNAVPIFDSKAAVEVTQMRRG